MLKSKLRRKVGTELELFQWKILRKEKKITRIKEITKITRKKEFFLGLRKRLSTEWLNGRLLGL